MDDGEAMNGRLNKHKILHHKSCRFMDDVALLKVSQDILVIVASAIHKMPSRMAVFLFSALGKDFLYHLIGIRGNFAAKCIFKHLFGRMDPFARMTLRFATKDIQAMNDLYDGNGAVSKPFLALALVTDQEKLSFVMQFGRISP